MSTGNHYLRLHPEVRDALQNHHPVVALESSIIAHGMPYPDNIETALLCEAIIREQGAVPATIAIKDHKICIGLSHDDIEDLGNKKRANPVDKLSRKDLGYALAQGRTGATTVAATMIAAHAAGIRFFATGGIGGVHRGAESSMDISADLDELARTPVAVICAGVKSILDIGRSLEVLETKGIPVIGYQTDELPAFFCRSSGYRTDCRAENADDVARILRCHWDVAWQGGALIGNPIPLKDAMAEDVVACFVNKALYEAERRNIRQKAVTPFLLDFIAQQTGAQSLAANKALVKNNALVATQIARAYYFLLAK